jgi:DNA-binding response OmpR family regulator
VSAAPHHLLVIDDEPFIARIVRQGFERGPFRVSGCPDAASGLAFLREHRDVQLVLLDLNMPGMSGAELLAMLRADAELAAMPVLILTAAGQVGQVEQVRSLGAAAIVTKPFSVKKLRRQVEDLLGVPPEHGAVGDA